jgi:drug/metabolite transporter (DMT)-like permease
MSDQIKAHQALLWANILYGFNYIVAKGIMPLYISPAALTTLRIFISTILFWAICFRSNNEKIERADLWRFILAGFIGVTLNQFLFLQGLNLSTPIDAAILTTTNPVLVLSVAAILGKEHITPIHITGIFLGAAGAIILVLHRGFTGFDYSHLAGNIMLVLNSIAFAFYLYLCKPLMRKYDTIFVMKWLFLFGAIIYLPFGIYFMHDVHLQQMPPQIIVGLCYIVIGTTFLTYFLNNYGLKYLRSTTVSSYIYLQPVIAAVTAYFVGMDKPTIINLTACIIVFIGVYLVSYEKKKSRAL